MTLEKDGRRAVETSGKINFDNNNNNDDDDDLEPCGGKRERMTKYIQYERLNNHWQAQMTLTLSRD